MELPDLEIGPAAPTPRQGVAQSSPEPPTAFSNMGELIVPMAFDIFDDADEERGDDAIRLEVVEEALEKRDLPGPDVPVAIASLRFAGSPSPSSAISLVEPIEVDPFELLALADFGPVPTSLWQTPLYAIRVFRRRAQLEKEIERIEKELKLREAAFSDSLVALVDDLRPALEEHPSGGRWFAPIYELELRARARGEALESVSAEFSAKVAEVDREIATGEEACEAELTKLAPLTEELERRKAEHGRAEAMLKRVEIEIRAAQQAARAAAGPDAKVAPPEHALKIQDLSKVREARAADVARTKAELDEVLKPHQARERLISDRRRQIAELRRGRKSLEEAYGRQLSVRTEGVAEAERERREMTVEIGARLLEDSPIAIEPAVRERVQRARGSFEAVVGELRKYQEAREAFDRGANGRGRAIIVSAGVLLLSIVLWFALFHDPDF